MACLSRLLGLFVLQESDFQKPNVYNGAFSSDTNIRISEDRKEKAIKRMMI